MMKSKPTELKQHVVVARPGYADELATELQVRWDLSGQVVSTAAVAFAEKAKLPPMSASIYGRQILPHAMRISSGDVTAIVATIVDRLEIMTKRANRQTGRWTLHAFALDDDPATALAGKIEKALMAAMKTSVSRFAKRYVPASDVASEPAADDLVLQVYVPGLTEVWFSLAPLGTGVSPYVAGILRMRHKEGAPSRSARKLQEAFVEMGRQPQVGETAIDLGAAPGGWSFVMATGGTAVTAVDHAALSLPPGKLKGSVTHVAENGLTYMPLLPVDWLCCDMVIAPQETLKVLGRWLEREWMRCFVVNVKLPQANAWPIVKEALELLERYKAYEVQVKHLYHDRSEVTLMGKRVADLGA